MNKKVLGEATLGMAFMDAIPVVLFAISIFCIGVSANSALVWIGLVLCTLAGAGKVVYKFILAIWKKQVAWLSLQFRYVMPTGFLLAVLHLVINARNIDWFNLYERVFRFPVGMLMLLSFVTFMVMGISASKMDMTKPKANWIEQGLNILAQVFFLFGCVILLYTNDSYKLDEAFADSLNSNDLVQVTESRHYLYFDGPGSESALIFFAGAKVDYEAYAPLMQKISQQGVDCFLLDLPYNMAFFGSTKPGIVWKRFGDAYENWYVGGHSLGGVMACTEAYGRLGDYKGLLLLASYSTKDFTNTDMKVLSIYGTEDKVLNVEKMNDAAALLPDDAKTVALSGGNHGQFGNYGHQDGDGEATISTEMQQSMTVSEFLDLVGKTN